MMMARTRALVPRLPQSCHKLSEIASFPGPRLAPQVQPISRQFFHDFIIASYDRLDLHKEGVGVGIRGQSAKR